MQADSYARVAGHHGLHPRAGEARLSARPLERVRLGSPFCCGRSSLRWRCVDGRVVKSLRRVGKRIAIGVEGDLWLVLHLMIAGRLHWKKRDAKLGGRQNLAAFDFPRWLAYC